ncbi:MAG: hypothetical protein LBG13_03135 [Holosporales bacterium]|jgi:hypothetical protein|nr:hypothetical protein [Holosporales bacterium]
MKYDLCIESLKSYIATDVYWCNAFGKRIKENTIDSRVLPIISSTLNADFLGLSWSAKQFKIQADKGANTLVKLCEAIYDEMSANDSLLVIKGANDASFNLIMEAIEQKNQLANEKKFKCEPAFDEKLIDELVQTKKVCEESLMLRLINVVRAWEELHPEFTSAE